MLEIDKLYFYSQISNLGIFRNKLCFNWSWNAPFMILGRRYMYRYAENSQIKVTWQSGGGARAYNTGARVQILLGIELKLPGLFFLSRRQTTSFRLEVSPLTSNRVTHTRIVSRVGSIGHLSTTISLPYGVRFPRLIVHFHRFFVFYTLGLFSCPEFLYFRKPNPKTCFYVFYVFWFFCSNSMYLLIMIRHKSNHDNNKNRHAFIYKQNKTYSFIFNHIYILTNIHIIRKNHIYSKQTGPEKNIKHHFLYLIILYMIIKEIKHLNNLLFHLFLWYALSAK